jgi:hypothetical protein
LVTDHKTIETSPVKLDPELNPTQARTMLSLHRVEQQKAGEQPALGKKSSAKLHVPWVLISLCVLVVGVIYWLRAGDAQSSTAPQPPSINAAEVDRGRTKATEEIALPKAVPNEEAPPSAASAAAEATKSEPEPDSQVSKPEPKTKLKAAKKRKLGEGTAPTSPAPPRELWLE